MRPNNSDSQSGNAFLMIIIGIVLFAALMFAISRGMNESPFAVSSKQAKVTASDIISYAQQLERGVVRMMQKSCSENDISFENMMVSGYEHAPAAPETCQLFNLNGGRITYKNPSSDIEEVIFNGGNYVEGVGSDCEAANCTDLIVLFKVSDTVCSAINQALSIGPFGEEPETFDKAKFTGNFDYADKITAAAGKTAACIADNGAFYFYSVLYSR